MDIKQKLLAYASQLSLDTDTMQFPDCEIEPEKIKVIMINETPPQNLNDWFYSKTDNPDYMKTTCSLFQNAGADVKSMEDILSLGIYITTAVKSPKSVYTVDSNVIKSHLPILKFELNFFPNLKAIMLMGDVAKKSINMLYKTETKKNLIPAESTYKIRGNQYYWGGIRVFPSYIMTGGNILIEKSKYQMVSEDILQMMKLIKE